MDSYFLQIKINQIVFSIRVNKTQVGECHLTSWDLEVWATKPPPWKWIRRQGDDGRRLVFSPSDREMGPPSERERDSSVSLSWREKRLKKRGMDEHKERYIYRQIIKISCCGLKHTKKKTQWWQIVRFASLSTCPQCVYIHCIQSLVFVISYWYSVSNRAPLREGLTSCSAAACCHPSLRLHERTPTPIHYQKQGGWGAAVTERERASANADLYFATLKRTLLFLWRVINGWKCLFVAWHLTRHAINKGGEQARMERRSLSRELGMEVGKKKWEGYLWQSKREGEMMKEIKCMKMSWSCWLHNMLLYIIF